MWDMVVWDVMMISTVAFVAFAGCFTPMVAIMLMKMDLEWRMTMRKTSTVSLIVTSVLSLLGNQ